MLTLVQATEELDNNSVAFGLIVWYNPSTGLYHAKVSRPPVRVDTSTYTTQAAAVTAARTLATTIT